MGNGSADNLVRLYSELVVLLTQEENLRNETEAKLAKAKLIIDPRNEFNKWLQTNTGKSWKQKQFEFQDGKCVACSDPLRLINQVTEIQDFYAAKLVPALRDTIDEQAKNIAEFLKQIGSNQGGNNG